MRVWRSPASKSLLALSLITLKPDDPAAHYRHLSDCHSIISAHWETPGEKFKERLNDLLRPCSGVRTGKLDSAKQVVFNPWRICAHRNVTILEQWT